MNSYNLFENKLAILLSRFPIIKQIIKKIYQRLNYLIYKKNYNIKLSDNITISEFSDNLNETFFGYYDKSPENESGEFLIFQSTILNTNVKPSNECSIDIILFDLNKNLIINRFKSSAYNWQQGSKIQWISKNQFVFNDFDENKNNYCSKIINTKLNDIEKIIDYPIYDVYKNIGISLNFGRLNKVRPDYGYRKKNNDEGNFNLNNEGILKINLEENTSKLLINLNEIINCHFHKNMDNAKHWVNHIMISPEGNHFVFLHRWQANNERYDALMYANMDGTNLKCITDNKMVSHFCWYGNNKLCVYMRGQNNVNNYFIIDLVLNTTKLIKNKTLQNIGDGHPSIKNDTLLIDTYPNKARMKELYTYKLKEDIISKIGEFYEGFDYYGETRCDLHPRWGNNSNIFIDSVHNNKRKLYKLKFNS